MIFIDDSLKSFHESASPIMKRVVFAFTLLISTVVATTAQTKKEITAMLARDLAAYNRVTLRSDFDSTLLFMPPAMFDLVPKDSMLVGMRMAMNNEHIRIEMLDFKHKAIPKIKKAGKYRWALVDYDGYLKMQLFGEPEFTSMMKRVIKAQYDEKNLESLDSNTVKIHLTDKKIIAFLDPTASHWYMLEDKRAKKGKGGGGFDNTMLKMIVPEEVLKAIGG